jgi:hypothetical protein
MLCRAWLGLAVAVHAEQRVVADGPERGLDSLVGRAVQSHVAPVRQQVVQLHAHVEVLVLLQSGRDEGATRLLRQLQLVAVVDQLEVDLLQHFEARGTESGR